MKSVLECAGACVRACAVRACVRARARRVSVCVWVRVWVCECVCVCARARACVRVYALRTVSMDRILRFTKALVIIIKPEIHFWRRLIPVSVTLTLNNAPLSLLTVPDPAAGGSDDYAKGGANIPVSYTLEMSPKEWRNGGFHLPEGWSARRFVTRGQASRPWRSGSSGSSDTPTTMAAARVQPQVGTVRVPGVGVRVVGGGSRRVGGGQ